MFYTTFHPLKISPQPIINSAPITKVHKLLLMEHSRAQHGQKTGSCAAFVKINISYLIVVTGTFSGDVLDIKRPNSKKGALSLLSATFV